MGTPAKYRRCELCGYYRHPDEMALGSHIKIGNQPRRRRLCLHCVGANNDNSAYLAADAAKTNVAA